MSVASLITDMSLGTEFAMHRRKASKGRTSGLQLSSSQGSRHRSRSAGFLVTGRPPMSQSVVHQFSKPHPCGFRRSRSNDWKRLRSHSIVAKVPYLSSELEVSEVVRRSRGRDQLVPTQLPVHPLHFLPQGYCHSLALEALLGVQVERVDNNAVVGTETGVGA